MGVTLSLVSTTPMLWILVTLAESLLTQQSTLLYLQGPRKKKVAAHAIFQPKVAAKMRIFLNTFFATFQREFRFLLITGEEKNCF